MLLLLLRARSLSISAIKGMSMNMQGGGGGGLFDFFKITSFSFFHLPNPSLDLKTGGGEYKYPVSGCTHRQQQGEHGMALYGNLNF